MTEIPYPSPARKEEAIAHILSASRTRRVSTLRFLAGAYREIGVGVILRHSVHIFLMSAGLFVMLIACAFEMLYDNVEAMSEKAVVAQSLAVFFFSSPFVLLSTDFLYQMQERPFDVYEMQNTCKFTARHLILLRMPLFSLATMLIDCAAALVWCAWQGTAPLPQLIGLIASGVLLYALVNLAMFLRFGLYGCAGCLTVWGALIIAFSRMPKAWQYSLMTGIPAVAHILSGLLMAALLTMLVRIFYQRPMCKVTA